MGPRNARLVWEKPGHGDDAYDVAFSPDGAELATVGEDGTVVVWKAETGAQARRFSRPGTEFTAAKFSPDGRTIAVAGRTPTSSDEDRDEVLLLDASDLRVTARRATKDEPATPRPTAWSPTTRPRSRSARTAGCSRPAAQMTPTHHSRLWDVSDPAAPRRHGPVLRGGNYLYSVVFRGRGDLVVAAGADGTVRLWDLAADPPVATTIAASDTYEFAVAVTPDGRTLAAAGGDNAVRLWDLADPHHPRRTGPTLTGPSNYVNALDFGPGNRLAAGSGDGTVWLWDVADAARPVLRATLTGPVGAVFAVGFRPAGDLLAASGADRTVRLWSTDPAGAARRVCAVAGDPITREEWARYVPGLTHAALSRAGLGAPPCPAPDEGRAPLSRAGRRAGHPCPPGRAEGRASRARPVPRLRPARWRPAPAGPAPPACRPPCRSR